MASAVICNPVRTAIGRYGGSLKDVPARDLGGTVIRESLRRAGVDPGQIADVILGCVGQVADDAYIGRTAALSAGLPNHSTAYAVNRLCGSGLQAINTATQCIAAGEADLLVAGGSENMSRLPFYDRNARWGHGLGHGRLEDGVVTLLSDPFQRYHMGVTAENLAQRDTISREDQDTFALQSQQKAVQAIQAGRFADQIVPIEIPQKRGDPVVFDTDEHPRADTSMERLSRLQPAFQDGGTVTAGNASGINDGAAAMIVASESRAEQLGLKPMARIVAQAVSGVDPEIMGIGPVPAAQKVLDKAGLTWDDIELIELNEAFAAQSLAVLRQWDADPERVNVNGGAIALGHPVGATGAILTVKLLHEMERTGARWGIVALCIGGGQGIATIFERFGG